MKLGDTGKSRECATEKGKQTIVFRTSELCYFASMARSDSTLQ